MNAAHVIRIPILPFGMVNAHLIRGPRGCVLVDAGRPGSEHKIGKALAREGLSFRAIKLIVITHAHVDHAGGAARLRELSGAPIVAHEGDLRHLRRELPMTFCATGWFGRLFLRTRLMYQPYEGFTPDLLLSGLAELSLEAYGVHGVVRHTPGHTAGSISVELGTREALVGDLIASGILLGGIARTGHAKRPPFEDDPGATARALLTLVDSGVQRYYMGHGGPLDADEVRRHAHALTDLVRAPAAPRS